MPNKGYKQTQEAKNKIGKGFKKHKSNCQCSFCKAERGELSGKNSPMYGYKYTVKAKEKQRQCALEQFKNGMPQKTRDKISKSNTGKKQSKNMINKVSGSNSALWKGDDIGYCSKHSRIRKIKGHASKCKCVGDGINKCDRYADDWSNVDHDYSLNPDEYQPRCRSCHIKYDFKFNKK